MRVLVHTTFDGTTTVRAFGGAAEREVSSSRAPCPRPGWAYVCAANATVQTTSAMRNGLRMTSNPIYQSNELATRWAAQTAPNAKHSRQLRAPKRGEAAAIMDSI